MTTILAQQEKHPPTQRIFRDEMLFMMNQFTSNSQPENARTHVSNKDPGFLVGKRFMFGCGFTIAVGRIIAIETDGNTKLTLYTDLPRLNGQPLLYLTVDFRAKFCHAILESERPDLRELSGTFQLID